MDADIRDLVSRIHTLGHRAVLAATGGGGSAAGWLLAVPGASRTVLEAVVPYAQAALDGWLGGPSESYCSAATARRMAARARDRAAWLAPGEPVVGVGCTAALRSEQPKRGDHRVHVAAASEAGVSSWSLTLAKGQREREGEEEVASRLVLNALATACGLSERVVIPLLPGERIESEEAEAGLLAALLAGAVDAVCVEPDGRMHADRREGLALLAGSFNPLHHGHLGMAEAAARRAGRPAAFELSVANPDKGMIGAAELRRRVAQFSGVAPLWLTRAPTFDQKARLFPGAVFVVGADTAERIVQTRFYADSIERMRAALGAVRACGCRFLVAGRVVGRGRFVGLEELAIPAEFANLFTAIPSDEFRADVSSTSLRGGG